MVSLDPIKITIFGLESSGKTTMLYKLKLDEVVPTIPTIGFNTEIININDKEIALWDFGGKVISIWKFYLSDTKAIIWMVDSSDDSNKLLLSKDTLLDFIDNNNIASLPILILPSKMDKDTSKTTSEIRNLFDEDLKKKNVKNVNYFPSSNVKEGIIWILSVIQ